MYDIQYELMNFKNDSAENMINQKFVLLNHTIKMQELAALISEDEYLRKFNEIWDLELSEHTAIRDSFAQRLIRLDYPEEMKIPRDLSKEVTLYKGIDGSIGFVKWLILVFSIVVIIIEYFKNSKSENNIERSPVKGIQPKASLQPQMIDGQGRTLKRSTNHADVLEDGEFWFNVKDDAGIFLSSEDIATWEQNNQTKPVVTPNKVGQSYSEMSKYNVVKDELGNSIITELTTIEQAIALKEDVEKYMEGNATVHTKLIPNEDKTAAQMYQLTIVFKDLN